MSGCTKAAIETVLRVLSLLLLVLAVLVGLSTQFFMRNYRRSSLFFSDANITLTALLAIICAAVLVLGGLLGWRISKDSPCAQGMFVYVLVLVFLLKSTASALAYFHSTQLHSELAPLGGIFMNYTGSSQDPLSRAVDATQEEFQCCGVNGYKDWLHIPWFNRTSGISVPLSCCNSTFVSCNGTVDLPFELYSQGCKVKLVQDLQYFLRFMYLDLPVVFLVEVILLVTVAQLMWIKPGYHNMDKRY